MSHDPNNPAILTSARDDIEAAVIVAALASRGVDASTTGGFTAGFRAEAPGDVNVIVKQVDLDRARKALTEIEEDWPDVE